VVVVVVVVVFLKEGQRLRKWIILVWMWLVNSWNGGNIF